MSENETVKFYRSVVKIALAAAFAVLLMAMLFIEFMDPDMALDPTVRYIVIMLILVFIGLADPKRLMGGGVD